MNHRLNSLALSIAELSPRVKPERIVQIDWSHPHSQFLFGDWLFNERGGTTVRDVAGLHNDGTFSGVYTWDLDRWAPVKNSGSATVLADGSALPTDEFTMFIRYRKDDTATDYPVTISHTSYATTDRALVHLGHSGNGVYWDWGGAITGTSRAHWTGFSADQQFHDYCFTVGPRGMEIWQDGVIVESHSNSATRTSTSNAWGLGVQTGGSDDSTIGFFRCYSKQLDRARIVSIFNAPFAHYKAANDRPFLYIVTSGGAYSLTCDPGSFAVTGTAASLLHDKSLDAATDSYVWTGTAAGLQYGSTISAEEGNYVWTGTAASVLHDKILVADTDSYAWTGSDATLTKAAASTYTLDCEGGIYAVNGTAVSFGRTYALSVDSGVYAWTGTDATLNYSAVPTEPYSIGYTGGGRIMKPGEFPEWWKEEEEPQPKVIKKKRSSKEQIAEAAAGLRVKEKHEKVVEFPKKPAGTSTPEVKEVEKEIKEDFKEKTESVNDEIKALREDIKNTSEKIKRTEKRILAALMLLSRQLRK